MFHPSHPTADSSIKKTKDQIRDCRRSGVRGRADGAHHGEWRWSGRRRRSRRGGRRRRVGGAERIGKMGTGVREARWWLGCLKPAGLAPASSGFVDPGPAEPARASRGPPPAPDSWAVARHCVMVVDAAVIPLPPPRPKSARLDGRVYPRLNLVTAASVLCIRGSTRSDRTLAVSPQVCWRFGHSFFDENAIWKTVILLMLCENWIASIGALRRSLRDCFQIKIIFLIIFSFFLCTCISFTLVQHYRNG